MIKFRFYKNLQNLFRLLSYESNDIRYINYLSIYYYEQNVITLLSHSRVINNTKNVREIISNDKAQVMRLIKNVYFDGIIDHNTCVNLVAFVRSCYSCKLLQLLPICYPLAMRIISKNMMRIKNNMYTKKNG